MKEMKEGEAGGAWETPSSAEEGQAVLGRVSEAAALPRAATASAEPSGSEQSGQQVRGKRITWEATPRVVKQRQEARRPMAREERLQLLRREHGAVAGDRPEEVSAVGHSSTVHVALLGRHDPLATATSTSTSRHPGSLAAA